MRRHDADNEPEKLMIVSEFPIICLIVLCVSSSFPVSLPMRLVQRISSSVVVVGVEDDTADSDTVLFT